MKNFIEIHLESSNELLLININLIEAVVRGNIIVTNSCSEYRCKESYDEIVEKIKQAQK